MTILLEDIYDRVASHAKKLGVFENVNKHEPKSAPGNGITAAIWVDRVRPIKLGGMNATSIVLTLNIRIYSSMLQEPQDLIDPKLVRALDRLMSEYTGNFTLDDTIRNVDLLGAHSDGLMAESGYMDMDKKIYRFFTIQLPLIINDVWSQEA